MELRESPASPVNCTNTPSGGSSVTSELSPWHSWPRGAPRLVSGSPGPDVMGLLVVVEPEVGAQFPPGITGQLPPASRPPVRPTIQAET